MIVVDASVLVAGVLDEGPEGAWALETLGRGSLAAPELLLVEATNIVRRLETARAIPTDAAAPAFRQIMSLPVELAPFAPFGP